MPLFARSPILSPLGILLVALSLSIGWGIRGNYGHETGRCFRARSPPSRLACYRAGPTGASASFISPSSAPLAGRSAARSATCKSSATRTRAILPSQAYGFACLFVIGFLWGSLGGGGRRISAALDRGRLTQLFVPMLVVLAAMGSADYIIPLINDKMQVEGAMKRQDSPLYWLDSDYLQACVAVVAMLLFDLFERRFARPGNCRSSPASAPRSASGVQWLLRTVGVSDPLWNLLVRPQGETGQFKVEQLVTNWPNFLPHASIISAGPWAWPLASRFTSHGAGDSRWVRACFCTWAWDGWPRSHCFPLCWRCA